MHAPAYCSHRFLRAMSGTEEDFENYWKVEESRPSPPPKRHRDILVASEIRVPMISHRETRVKKANFKTASVLFMLLLIPNIRLLR